MWQDFLRMSKHILIKVYGQHVGSTKYIPAHKALLYYCLHRNQDLLKIMEKPLPALAIEELDSYVVNNEPILVIIEDVSDNDVS